MTDAHGITAIDLTGDIVTAIDIVDVATTDDHTCRISWREVIAGNIPGLHGIAVLIQRSDVGHTAAAKQVVNNDLRVFIDSEEKALGTGHVSLVTAGVEVTDHTALEEPCGTDGHHGHVVTAEEASDLELIAARIRQTGVDAHANLETIIGQQLLAMVIDMVDHLTRVIHTDVRLVRHRSVVTATIGIDDGSTDDLEIGLAQLGQGETRVVFGLFTITATEELTDIDGGSGCLFISLAGRLHILLRTDADKGIPVLSHTVGSSLCQFGW